MIAIHYAYSKMTNGGIPHTYETAQLRQFYHGRTETTRTYSLATKNFVQAMMDPESSLDKKQETFAQAHQAYLYESFEAMNFRAFDRYLLALSSLEDAEGNPCPITEHFSYRKGGASNFMISASSLGSQPEEAVPPLGGCMPFREDGYGTFTAYTESKTFVNIWWLVSGGTDGEKFGETIKECADEILELIKSMA